MTARLRVLIFAAAPGDDPDAVVRAYHRISRDLRGTPGLISNELLRATTDEARFIVMSEWESVEAFEVWERGSAHKGTTAPLRQYQDSSRGAPFGLYEVAAAY
ncbi:antibiotic biosynthesis monooxygenase [Paractinoplanes ferrugineus]|uniref:Antibiotic biosynthesis monooxygenase n=1 Tax=Paractinoplanes ferrugineus TaxID=113564 RepID=A0A919MII6_9ACTN|nr:antibiotic biosynthesis monooxygenase [Actinoplanes ferrugineus]GIE13725.1 antibiotic biosynthesis monooxygenase [Actinoplanes ferrugineus]